MNVAQTKQTTTRSKDLLDIASLSESEIPSTPRNRKAV